MSTAWCRTSAPRRPQPRGYPPPAALVHAAPHLEPAVAVLQLEPRRLDQLITVVLGEAEGAVGRRPVARAAQELRDRAPGQLAVDVPARDVDGGKRAGDDARHRALVDLPPHLLVDRLGVARVHVLQQGQELLLDRGDDREWEGGGAGEGAAHVALMGFDFGEHRVSDY